MARIHSAIEQGFLKRELDIVRPKVVILLGVHAYESFYRHILKRPIRLSLSEIVTRIRTVQLEQFEGATIVPFFHPSPVSPASGRWFRSFPNSRMTRDFILRVKALLRRNLQQKGL